MTASLQLQKWREGLLDLTRRNRLIHFNPDTGPKVRAPHGIWIAKPDLDRVWDRLALHERLQEFYELQSEAQTLDLADEARVPTPERALKANELRAFPDGPKLGRMLANLRTRSRTSLDEQGLNTLFVAFGFLRWRDKDNKELLSPLFLVPVELLRKSPRDPFKMRGLGEDGVFNPALKLKLKNDFGLEFPAHLPTQEGTRGQSVEAQLREVQVSLSARFPTWRVENLAFVGLFSFHKIAMFNDLRDNSAPLLAHPLVRTVCGERGLLAASTSINAEDLDNLSPVESQLVVEADSSQHRAILAARRGASFVLQGPPGTGKSQTITNIIAECLENRKTVLFVSEKMAALDVVLSRLQAVGLGDACLELHSSKANKKEVIYELGRTLLLGHAPAPTSPDEERELARLRTRLGASARARHQKIAPAQLSIFEAIGQGARFHDAPELLFGFDEAPFRTPQERAEIENWLAQLEELDAVMRQARTHPWRGVRLESSLEARSRLLVACDQAVQVATRLENHWRNAAPVWGWTSDLADLKTFDSALKTLQLAAEFEPRDFLLNALELMGEGAMVQRAFAATLRSLAQGARPLCEELSARLEAWGSDWNVALLELDSRALQANLSDAQWWFEAAGSGAALHGSASVLRRACAPGDASLGAICSQLQEQSAILAALMGRAAPQNLTQTVQLTRIVDALAELPLVPAAWWPRGAGEAARSALLEAQSAFNERETLLSVLASEWNLTRAPSFDFPDLSLLESDRAHFTRGLWDEIVTGLPQTSASDTNLKTALSDLRRHSAGLARVLDQEAPASLQEAKELLLLGERIENCPLLEAHWLEAQAWRNAHQILGEAKGTYTRRQFLQQRLGNHWRNEALSDDLASDGALISSQESHLGEPQSVREKWQAPLQPGSEPRNSAGEIFERARQAGERWRAILSDESATQNAAKMSCAQLFEWADVLRDASRCHLQSAVWLRFGGDLVASTRGLRLEIKALESATQELAARWKKGALVAFFDTAWSAHFVALRQANAETLRAIWQSALGETGALISSGDLDSLGQIWGQVAERAAQLAEFLEMPVPSYGRASRELLEWADSLGDATIFPARWLVPGVLTEIERLFQRALAANAEWERAGADLGTLRSALQNVPGENPGLLELQARWSSYRTWFRRFGEAYRRDCARVAALYSPAPVPDRDAVSRDLAKLHALQEAQKRVDEARRDLETTLGFASPDGAEGWLHLEQQLAAARPLLNRHQDWTPRQNAIIEGQQRGQLKVLRRELRIALELLGRAAFSVSEGAASRQIPVWVPHPDAPFEAVAAWIKARGALILPDGFEPSGVARDFAAAVGLQERRQKLDLQLEGAQRLFGPLWQSERTDWAALDEAIASFETARKRRLWNPALATRLFGSDESRSGSRELFAAAGEVARLIVDALKKHSPAHFLGPDADLQPLEAALRSLQNYKLPGWSVAQAGQGAQDWARLQEAERQIEAREKSYAQTLGARFDRERTDWGVLEEALESAQFWAETAPNPAVNGFLTAPRDGRSDLISQVEAARSAIARWRWGLQSAQAASSDAHRGDFPDEGASFESVSHWLRVREFFLAPNNFTWDHWGVLLERRRRIEELNRLIEVQSPLWQQRVGARWNSERTDYADCHAALQRVEAFCALCGTVPEPVKLAAQDEAAKSAALGDWAPRREQLRQLQEQFRAQIQDLQTLPWFGAAFFEGEFPSQRAFSSLLQGLEERAPALLKALGSMETIAQNALSMQVWNDETVREMLRLHPQIRAQKSQFEAQVPRLQREFGTLFQSSATDWNQVDGAVAGLEALILAARENGLSAALRAQLQRENAPAKAIECYQSLSAPRAELEAALQIVTAAFPGEGDWKTPAQLSLGRIRTLLSAKIRARDELEAWLRFAALVERGRELGLASGLAAGVSRFLEVVCEQLPPKEQLGRAFWRRFWALWVHDLTPHHASLREWNGASHREETRRFAEADERSQRRAALSLQSELSLRRPGVNAGAVNDPRATHLLLHEAGKSRSHMALRQLLAEIPRMAQQLKPCFLMSPLSVAHFLEFGGIHFDIVIFDEASQICPEDAIGAIGRASQMVVVGDKQQLPPTRVFAGGALEDDFEDDSEAETETQATTQPTTQPTTEAESEPLPVTSTALQSAATATKNGDVESILAHCEAVGLPQFSLLWHYRSRHEELIAFSNRHFYDARLQTFPAPRLVGADALQWIKVDGFYQPSTAGAGRTGGTNRIEARHMAKLVADHARQNPHRSLGVITFNEPQRRAVEEELTRLRLRDAGLDAFLDDERPEAFFVKALENVQGDERDAIFFSVGFGPRQDLSGKVLPLLMSFGPLTREGGERRLNVAITRAKHQIKIVTSFDPGQIRSEKLKYKGGKLLRAYLEWASASKHQAAPSRPEHASSLAVAIAEALQKRGWRCELNVGLGDYRVDVGVADARGAAMRVGIVLDGPFYLSAPTVRDRDRLRPMVLERLGWTIVPVWSLDCAPEFERQIEKIDALLLAQTP